MLRTELEGVAPTRQVPGKRTELKGDSVSDILEVLRRLAHRRTRHDYGIGSYWNAVEEAADEIERLRTELAQARLDLNTASDGWLNEIQQERGDMTDADIAERWPKLAAIRALRNRDK